MILNGKIGTVLPNNKPNKSFRISAWVSPVLGTYDPKGSDLYVTDDLYKAIKDVGLTHIYALYENADIKSTVMAIKAARKFGIKYYVRDTNTKVKDPHKGDLLKLESVKQYKDLDGWYGHLINDEPNANIFPYLRKLKDVYEADFPGKDFYVNLEPSYAEEWQLGTKTYEEYIDKWIEILNPKYISLDHYALMMDDEHTGKPYLTDDVLYNYEVVSDRCRKYRLDMYTFIANIQYNTHSRLPNEKEVWWQLFTQLCYGSRGIQYFCYMSPLEFKNDPHWSKAMVDTNCEIGEQYYYAKKINEYLKLINDDYFSYQHMGTMLVSGSNSVIANKAYIKTKNSVKSHSIIENVNSDEDVIIGCFNNQNDESSFMIMNYTDPCLNKASNIKIKFLNANYILLYYNNKRTKIRLENNTFSFKLESGEGMFVIPLELSEND